MVHNIKLKKRIWSMLLCLCMVLSCLPVSVFATGETETACTETDCNGHYENGFCTENSAHYQAAVKNADDYYEISNAGQLYWFAAKVNGGEWSLNGKLMADITVNENLVESFEFSKGYITPEPTPAPRIWTPIGGDNYNWETTTVNSGVGYAGTFDGDGKTISGLYYDSRKVTIPEDDKWGASYYAVGLFGFLNGATLKDITVTDSIFYSAHHIGNTSNKDCRRLFLGGIAGGVVADNKATTIEGCTVKSSVLTAHQQSGDGEGTSGYYDVYLGGILGRGERSQAPQTAGLTIRNCVADNVTLHAYALVRDFVVGGIMGDMLAAELSLTMENCRTYGVMFDYVKSTRTEDSYGKGYSGIGGIIGCVDAETYDARIKGCTASDDKFKNIGISNSNSSIGGIVGFAYTRRSNDGSKGTFTIKNCANTGDVCTPEDGNVSSTANVGGIVGKAESNENGAVTIEGCYNTGAVTANCEGEGEITSYAGAVIGRRADTVTGTFSGLYYKTSTATAASGDGSAIDGATEKSPDAFASGEVCYLLNGSTSEGTPVWYQILVEGGDPSPVLDSAHGIVSYDAETGKYSSTGTLTATVSVTITWTLMAFTYTDGAWDPAAHDYGVGTWSTSGGTIQVENTGNVTVTASFAYASETGVGGISGGFEASSFDLAENTSQTTKLTLSGKPSKSLNNESIGTITVSIVKKSE